MTLTLLQQSWPASIHKLPLQVLYQNVSWEELTCLCWSKKFVNTITTHEKKKTCDGKKQCHEVTTHRYYTAVVWQCSSCGVHTLLLASKSWEFELVMHGFATSCQLSAQPCTCTGRSRQPCEGEMTSCYLQWQMFMRCYRCELLSSGMTRLVCKRNAMNVFKMQVLPQSWPGIHMKFRWGGCNALYQCAKTWTDCTAASPELGCLCRMFAVG